MSGAWETETKEECHQRHLGFWCCMIHSGYYVGQKNRYYQDLLILINQTKVASPYFFRPHLDLKWSYIYI